jgi:hypothetical protein
MARACFKANPAGIAAVGRAEFMWRELEHRADRIRFGLEADAPEDTREYKRKIGRERVVAKTATVRVTARAGHSAVLEFGSRPHIIEPKNKKALAWPGGRHPVRRVHHPGTPALHLLRNAAIKYGGGR